MSTDTASRNGELVLSLFCAGEAPLPVPPPKVGISETTPLRGLAHLAAEMEGTARNRVR